MSKGFDLFGVPKRAKRRLEHCQKVPGGAFCGVRMCQDFGEFGPDGAKGFQMLFFCVFCCQDVPAGFWDLKNILCVVRWVMKKEMMGEWDRLIK